MIKYEECGRTCFTSMTLVRKSGNLILIKNLHKTVNIRYKDRYKYYTLHNGYKLALYETLDQSYLHMAVNTVLKLGMAGLVFVFHGTVL